MGLLRRARLRSAPQMGSSMTLIGKRVELELEDIVFATDFSLASKMAGSFAASIAKQYHSTVHIVHLVDLSNMFQIPDGFVNIEFLEKNAEENLGKFKAELALQKIAATINIKGTFNPAQEILQIAGEKSADLIVCGTRGHQGVARLVLGSTAEKMIHHAESPVLTVGPEVAAPSPTGIFERIVYATDFSPEAAKAAILALSFAQDRGSHLYLCHVLPRGDRDHPIDGLELTQQYTAALRSLVPDAAREWCEPECIVEHGYAADGILLLAHRVNADLIVMGARRLSHWFEELKAGIAYQVARAAVCPVLTVRG